MTTSVTSRETKTRAHGRTAHWLAAGAAALALVALGGIAVQQTRGGGDAVRTVPVSAPPVEGAGPRMTGEAGATRVERDQPAERGTGTDGTAPLMGGVAERYLMQARPAWTPQRLTVYIAGTPEQVDAVQHMIDDEQRTGEFVVLAAPDDVAEHLAAERVEPYAIGPEQIQVVDLRVP